jgi:hypothetical protein
MKERFEPAQQFQFYLMGQAARKLLSVAGMNARTYVADNPMAQDVIRASVGISESDFVPDIGACVLPVLSVARPAEVQAGWDYEIAYAVQDADKSRRVVVSNDPVIGMHGIVASCLGGRDRELLSAPGANGIICDLERQVDSLGQVVSLTA